LSFLNCPLSRPNQPTLISFKVSRLLASVLQPTPSDIAATAAAASTASSSSAAASAGVGAATAAAAGEDEQTTLGVMLSLSKLSRDAVLRDTTGEARRVVAALRSSDNGAPVLKFTELFGPVSLGVDQSRREIMLQRRADARARRAVTVDALEQELLELEQAQLAKALDGQQADDALFVGALDAAAADDERSFLHDDALVAPLDSAFARAQTVRSLALAAAPLKRRRVQHTSAALDDASSSSSAAAAAAAADALADAALSPMFSDLSLRNWEREILWGDDDGDASESVHDAADLPYGAPPRVAADALPDSLSVERGVLTLRRAYAPCAKSVLSLHLHDDDKGNVTCGRLSVKGHTHLAGALRLVLPDKWPARRLSALELRCVDGGPLHGNFARVSIVRASGAAPEAALSRVAAETRLVDGVLVALVASDRPALGALVRGVKERAAAAQSAATQAAAAAREARRAASASAQLERLLVPHVARVDSDDWLSRVLWSEDDAARVPRAPLILDENDAGMLLVAEDDARAAAAAADDGDEDYEELRKRKLSQFDLSNDQFYQHTVKTNTKVMQTSLQHSVPAQQISDKLFSLTMTDAELELYHKPRGYFGADVVLWLKPPAIQSASAVRNTGDVPRTVQELSAAPIEKPVMLLEYSEQRPLLMLNVGMAMRVRNFYRKARADTDTSKMTFARGETVVLEPTDGSPFAVGDVAAGATMVALDTPLMKAPLFEHRPRSTDFLLVRSQTENSFVVREVDSMFVVGQCQPNVEVPAPNSRLAQNIARNRMAAFVTRCFRYTKLVNIADLMHNFPQMSDGAVRKRLKACAVPARNIGTGTGWWAKDDSIKLQSEEELLGLITPEMVCAYDSMRSAEHLLMKNGIERLTHLSSPLELLLKDIPENHPLRAGIAAFRGELLRTPWNITQCFLNAIQGKVVMRLAGPGDPSRGRFHGFSYIKREVRRGGAHDSRTLRNLTTEALHKWLIDHRVPEKRIEPLGRNDRVSLARQIVADDYNVAVALRKFVRAGNKFTPEGEADAAMIKECFQRQQEVFANANDPELSDDYGSDFDDRRELAAAMGDEDELTAYGRDLEAELLGYVKENADRQKAEQAALKSAKGKKAVPSSQEKRDLDDLIADHKAEPDAAAAAAASGNGGAEASSSSVPVTGARRCVRRTVVMSNPDGSISKRFELIYDDDRIEQLLKRKQQRMGNKINANKDVLEMQLRALERHKELLQKGEVAAAPNIRQVSAATCSACGGRGHKKSNKSCPKYFETHPNAKRPGPKVTRRGRIPNAEKYAMLGIEPPPPKPRKQSATGRTRKPNGAGRGRKSGRDSEDDDDEPDDDIVVPDDEDVETGAGDDDDGAGGDELADLLQDQFTAQALALDRTKRRRAKPAPSRLTGAVGDLNQLVAPILAAIARAHDAFATPVPRTVPDYHNEIAEPLDLGTMRARARRNYYTSLQQVRDDLRLIVENCERFNSAPVEGRWPGFIPVAHQMLADASAALDERADEFRRIEHSIETGEPLEPAEVAVAQLGGEDDSSSEDFEAEDGEEPEDEFEIEDDSD
jgi:hypothetical protein